MQKIDIIEMVKEPEKNLKLRKWFTRDNLLILVLAGILLFVITLPTGKAEEASETQKVLKKDSGEEAGSVSFGVDNGETGAATDLEEYTAKQEEKLRGLLMSMEGVGDVEVMLTFVSSEELVVEKDAPVVRSNTVEKDSAGGTRTITQYDAGDTTVYNNASGEGEPYVVKTLSPRVEGVLVVAQGGSNSEVSRNITEAVQALFGVEAHRVKVLDMGAQTSTGRTVTGLSGN